MRDPRLILLAALLGIAAGVVVYLGQDEGVDPASTPLLEETDEDEALDPEAALQGAGAGAAQGPAPEEDNPFADETDVRVLLVATLDYRTTKAAWARLEALLRDDPERVAELLALLRPGTVANDFYIARQCEQIGQLLAKLGRTGLTALLDALEDDDPHYLLRIAACLGPFGERAAPAVPRLIDLMYAAGEEPPEKMTALYVDVLGRIGPASKKILPTLHRWLDEGETEVVEIAAARALVRIGGPTKEVFQRAADVMAVGPWQGQRRVIAQELGAMGKRAAPMLPELLRLAREGEDGSVQGTAVNLIGMIGVPDPDAIAQLEQDLTKTTSLEAFGGPWGFALSKLGPPGRAALVRAVEAHAPLSAGYATRHLLAGGLGSKRIWSLLEPGIVLPQPEAERVEMMGALSYFFENGGKVPAAAAVRLMPTFMAYKDDTWTRRSGLSFAYHVDRHTQAWCDMLQALLRDSGISEYDHHIRSEIAGVLTRSTKADRAKTLEGIQQLIGDDPSDGSHYHLLIPFVPTHPQPVVRTWRTGVEQGAVGWDTLRIWLTKGEPPKLVAPPSVAKAIREGMSGG
ncbi:MAG: hypothetical protein QNJ98_01070 [Planctomycetota bacterium]|nr:hypothetical protein [Planctomycetota bacterium]